MLSGTGTVCLTQTWANVCVYSYSTSLFSSARGLFLENPVLGVNNSFPSSGFPLGVIFNPFIHVKITWPMCGKGKPSVVMRFSFPEPRVASEISNPLGKLSWKFLSPAHLSQENIPKQNQEEMGRKRRTGIGVLGDGMFQSAHKSSGKNAHVS